MRSFLRLLSYAKPYSRYWPGYLILTILSVIFGIANYALISPLLTVLFEPNTVGVIVKPEYSFSIDFVKGTFEYYMSNIMASHGVLKALLYVCIAFMCASLLANLTHYFSQRILVSMKTRIMLRIRKDLFHKVSRMHIGYFHERQKGDILSVSPMTLQRYRLRWPVRSTFFSEIRCS